MPRRKDLDGLRGVAVLLTISLHYIFRSGFFPPVGSPHLAQLLDSAWAGVDIFFVLSGFLIGGIILDHGHVDGFLRAFYLRRALRILPVVSIAIAFSYLVLPLLNPSVLWSAQVPPWAYLLFINNFWTALGRHSFSPLGPLWSLAIEEQFYLVAPMLLLSLPTKARTTLLVATILISPCLRLWHGAWSSWDFTLYRLDGLAAGLLMADVVRKPVFDVFAARHRRAIAGAVVGLVAVSLWFASSSNFSDTQRLAYGIWLNSLATAGIVVFLQATTGSFLSNLLSGSWLLAFGRYSYFLYLLHMPILFYVLAAFDSVPPAYAVILAFIVTFAGAAASWRFLESRAIALGKNYPYTKPPPGINGAVTFATNES